MLPPLIQLDNCGKKFGKEWIFRHVSLQVQPADRWVILGYNGSGKSTLLQAIAGYVSLSEGKLNYLQGSTVLPEHLQYQQVSLASPYLDLVDDFTLAEMVEHAATFKPFQNNLRPKDVIELSDLKQAANKSIKLFSSGMRQRVKLALAILAEAPLLLLDEPVSNLDATAIQWYLHLVDTYAKDKTILVCSNSIASEYSFCDKVLDMSSFK